MTRKKPLTVMEVCGTHTVAIAKNGLRQLYKNKVNFVSGPGCPVCVSAQSDIDAMISLAKNKNCIITTFGDMLRVSGSDGHTLQNARIEGADIRILYNPLDALKIAKENPSKQIVFLAVGFETTAPLAAALVLAAKEQQIKNISLYCCLKQICPAINAILKEDNNIDAFLLPGNVSVIIGQKPYGFIADLYKKPAVIAGFSAGEITQAVTQIQNMNAPAVKNAYIWVKPTGNTEAQKLLAQVFDAGAAEWRGFGEIANSAFNLRPEFADFDAKTIFKIKHKPSKPSACKCAAVLKGQIKPTDCPFFAKQCTPQNPIGPCMVSSEGACGAYYDY